MSQARRSTHPYSFVQHLVEEDWIQISCILLGFSNGGGSRVPPLAGIRTPLHTNTAANRSIFSFPGCFPWRHASTSLCSENATRLHASPGTFFLGFCDAHTLSRPNPSLGFPTSFYALPQTPHSNRSKTSTAPPAVVFFSWRALQRRSPRLRWGSGRGWRWRVPGTAGFPSPPDGVSLRPPPLSCFRREREGGGWRARRDVMHGGHEKR